ncbi:MORN repeat-containing protein 3 isoform X1 [Monodon monoceros]|uniref:MORN repeat-containing protein 3 isoform X1 n=1 Tax=Monodon monoceros TaxID=40151 RepID=UPI0010F4916D|nr:MORN repeat-containing protein 3 isoform X1 [Monodon monoceros]
MPISKCPPKSEPLWKAWDRKAQKNGLRHQVFAVNGDHYVGKWKDNLKHGKGTQVWRKNGAIYEGDWKFGKRDGYGTLSLSDQETGKYRRVYSGWWKGDKKCGYGIQFFGPKEYYEGDWCGNQRSGWGRMYYSNGDIYEGQWCNDKPEGEGMLRLKNGNRYEGNWQRGMKNGWGRFFHLDHGQLFEGLWVDNIAKCGTMIDCGRDEAPKPTQFPIPEVGSSPGSWGHTQPRERQNSTHSHTQPGRAQPGQETDKVLSSVRATPGRLVVPPKAGSAPKAGSLGLPCSPNQPLLLPSRSKF